MQQGRPKPPLLPPINYSQSTASPNNADRVAGYWPAQDAGQIAAYHEASSMNKYSFLPRFGVTWS